ncbi:Apolipoprotein A-IV [Anabarilius grahami]|uniref:Apolipoprotein A-IV n=1 Tax=Anabarilius grahami TaxID=495550 RepID=A0A3N0YNT4_ANAGA|nr:Apolipoprotein A-IV [Anabarilius grahami]
MSAWVVAARMGTAEAVRPNNNHAGFDDLRHLTARRVSYAPYSEAGTEVVGCVEMKRPNSCQANLFSADEPKPQLEQLTDAFWSYVSKATQTAEETVKMIRSSQLGEEVNARLTQSADMASEYAVTLKKQMDPLAEELMTKITKEAEVLRERLGQDLITVRDQLEPYADNLKSQIQQRVEELRAAMAPYAESLDSETLKATLLQKSEELRGNLEQSVKELQAQLEPYTAEIKEKVDQRLQEFQKTVSPLAEDLQTQIRERAQMVQQSLTPYAEDLKEKLDPYAQDLKDQLTSLYESFIKRN